MRYGVGEVSTAVGLGCPVDAVLCVDATPVSSLWGLGLVSPSAPGSARRKTQGIADGSLACECPVRTAWGPLAPHDTEGEVTTTGVAAMTGHSRGCELLSAGHHAALC